MKLNIPLYLRRIESLTQLGSKVVDKFSDLKKFKFILTYPI